MGVATPVTSSPSPSAPPGRFHALSITSAKKMLIPAPKLSNWPSQPAVPSSTEPSGRKWRGLSCAPSQPKPGGPVSSPKPPSPVSSDSDSSPVEGWSESGSGSGSGSADDPLDPDPGRGTRMSSGPSRRSDHSTSSGLSLTVLPFLSTMMVSRVPTPPPRGLHGSRFTHGHNDFERLLAALIADLQALRDAFREIYNPNEATAPASAKSPCATAAACTNSASDAPGGPFFRRAPRCAGDAGGSPVGVRRCFRDFDVLLCPVTPMTATPHGVQELVINGVTASWLHVMDITSFFNLLACLRFRCRTASAPRNCRSEFSSFRSGSMSPPFCDSVRCSNARAVWAIAVLRFRRRRSRRGAGISGPPISGRQD